MDRLTIINSISNKLKLIRTEKNYTQEQMADILGLSKKTLVQIEKRRIDCGWTVAVAVCAIFQQSSILQNTMGGDPMECISLVINDGVLRENELDVNNFIWWRTERIIDDWSLQRNILHHSYRLVDKDSNVLIVALEKEVVEKEWEKLRK